MNNLTLKVWLQFLSQHAPKMEIQHAMEVANKIASTEAEMMQDAEALAILAHTKLGFGDDGDTADSRAKVTEKAIEQASYRHAWVVCGPVNNGMSKLMDEWEKKR